MERSPAGIVKAALLFRFDVVTVVNVDADGVDVAVLVVCCCVLVVVVDVVVVCCCCCCVCCLLLIL